jgi:FAD/FMN-containing dehydrogenase
MPDNKDHDNKHNVKITTSNDSNYTILRFNWDTRFNIYSKAIVQPLNEKGAIETLRYVKRTGINFSIRGGKHCFESWSLSTGIIIDLSLLNHIELRDNIAYIGAGATLGNIYNVLNSQGRTIGAGTRPTVGIGGQGMNGGIGYSTRYLGLLTDAIIAYRVLLADGKIHDVSKDHLPDLF